MGAWGEGMQANDTALDAIPFFEEDEVQPEMTKEYVTELFDGLSNWMSRENMAILGLAEWCIEQGADLDWLPMEKITDALGEELTYSRLEEWRSPEVRRDALKTFEKRLKPVSKNEEKQIKAKTAEHNKGLFQRMAEDL